MVRQQVSLTAARSLGSYNNAVALIDALMGLEGIVKRIHIHIQWHCQNACPSFLHTLLREAYHADPLTKQRSSLVNLVKRQPSSNSPARAAEEALAVIRDLDVRHHIHSTVLISLSLPKHHQQTKLTERP
jgi:hypothetical protein